MMDWSTKMLAPIMLVHPGHGAKAGALSSVSATVVGDTDEMRALDGQRARVHQLFRF